MRIGAALLTAFILAGCTHRTAPPPTMADLEAEPAPEHEVWDARYYITDAGKPRVEIDAPYLAQFEVPESTFTRMEALPDSGKKVVTAQIYDEEGNYSATLTARELIYYKADGRYEARGGVVITTPEGRRLEGEHVTWQQRDRKVRTLGFVRITTPRERIQGYNLVADEDLETYTLARITGQVTIEEG